jgi:hypothetical protein
VVPERLETRCAEQAESQLVQGAYVDLLRAQAA